MENQTLTADALPPAARLDRAVEPFQGLAGLLVHLFLMLLDFLPEAFRDGWLNQEEGLSLADDDFMGAGVVLDEVAGLHAPGFAVDSVGEFHPFSQHRRGRFAVLGDVVMKHLDLFRAESGRQG